MDDHPHVDWNTFNNEVSLAILQSGRLEDLLSDLGCDLRTRHGRYYRGACPVHDGDGPNMQIDTGGYDLPIVWACFSRGCHEQFKPSLLGLVRGILSNREGRKARMREAADVLRKYAGDVPLPNAGMSARPRRQPNVLDLSREQVRRRLTIPSRHFLSRGFSPEVLDAFDVGDSPKLKMAVVPLYDDAGSTCIGFVARSQYPQCEQCGRHHYGHRCEYGQSKWRMLDGFPKEDYLYNYATAKNTDAPFVFLVEGVPDVLRLAEAGYVGVALLGTHFTDMQLKKLAALRKEIWVSFDNDEAGRSALVRLDRRLESGKVSLPTVSFRYLARTDIGDTPVARLRSGVEDRLLGVVQFDQVLAEDMRNWQCDARLEKSKRRVVEHRAWLERMGDTIAGPPACDQVVQTSISLAS